MERETSEKKAEKERGQEKGRPMQKEEREKDERG